MSNAATLFSDDVRDNFKSKYRRPTPGYLQKNQKTSHFLLR